MNKHITINYFIVTITLTSLSLVSTAGYAELLPVGLAQYESEIACHDNDPSSWIAVWEDKSDATDEILIRKSSNGLFSEIRENIINHNLKWDNEDSTPNTVIGDIHFFKDPEATSQKGGFTYRYETFVRGGNEGNRDLKARISLHGNANLNFRYQAETERQFFSPFIFIKGSTYGGSDGDTSHTTLFSNNRIEVLSGNNFGNIKSTNQIFEQHTYDGMFSYDAYPELRLVLDHIAEHTQACCTTDRNRGGASIQYEIIDPAKCPVAQEHFLPTQVDFDSLPDWTIPAKDRTSIQESRSLDLATALQRLLCMQSIPKQKTPTEIEKYPLAASWNFRGLTIYPRLNFLEKYFMLFEDMPTLSFIAAKAIENFWVSSFNDFGGILSSAARHQRQTADTLVGDHEGSVFNLLQNVAGYTHKSKKQKDLLKNVVLLYDENETKNSLSALSYINRILEDPDNISFEELDDAIMTALVLGSDARQEATMLTIESELMREYGNLFLESF